MDEQTTGGAAAAPEAPVPQAAPPQTPPGDVLTAYLALVRAQPGVVPDLISGSTLEDITASVERAKAAYAELRQRVLAEAGQAVPPANGAAGASARPPAPGYATILA